VPSADFRLHTLGWRAFQDLCQTVLREVLGQHLQVFSDSRDGGRDGAFYGPASPVLEGALAGLQGQVVVQVKHTALADSHLSLSDMTDELGKANRLVVSGQCETYVLMTNALLTGTSEGAIRLALVAEGVKAPLILGGEWLAQTIRSSARLRSMVPRLYGLGDLSQILDLRAYEQAKALLESRRDELALFVPTDAYRRAEAALHEHGFVLILGEPGAGKSIIAATLAAGAADKWGTEIVETNHPNEVRQHWNPQEATLFWADDAFGVMHFDQDRMDAWNRTFGMIPSILRGRSRIVLTSRDYIWSAARRHLKEGSFPFLVEDQVVIDVEQLTTSEREDILYGHLKHGAQPRGFLTAVKPLLREIAADTALLPESARRLAHPLFTQGLVEGDATQVRHFLAHPEHYLRDVLRQLEPDAEAAVALVFAHGQHLDSPLALTDDDVATLELLGASRAGVRRALKDLQGSLISHDAGEGWWRFRHPSVGDGYAGLLSEDPEKMSVYVRGAPIERLLSEATVGITDLEGAAVVIPRALEALLRDRLDDIGVGDRNLVWRFLAARSSGSFARAYLDSRPDLLRPLTHPGMFIGNWRPEVVLLETLNNRGGLPEVGRLEFVQHIAEIAVEGPDSSWCDNDRVRSVLGPDGVGVVRAAVFKALVSEPDDLRAGWDSSNYPGRSWGTPDSWTEELREAAEAYAKEFAEDSKAVSAARDLLSFGDALTQDLLEDNPEMDESDSERPSSPLLVRPLPNDVPAQQDRDVFDDLDL
jgi:hypothetical protein